MSVIISRRSWVEIAKVAGLTIALLILFAAWTVYEFGSVPAALAYASGERLLADDPMKSFGRLRVGQSRTIEFHIQNREDTPVTVLGATSSCTCTVAENLPISLKGAESRPLVLSFKAKRTGAISETVSLYTDSARKRTLTLTIRGWVEPAEAAPEPPGVVRGEVTK